MKTPLIRSQAIAIVFLENTLSVYSLAHRNIYFPDETTLYVRFTRRLERNWNIFARENEKSILTVHFFMKGSTSWAYAFVK